MKVNLWEGQLGSLAWAWDNARIFQTASLFILGMLMGRQGWLLRRNLRHWVAVMGWALVAFFPLSGLAGMLPSFIDNQNLLRPMLVVINSLAKVSFMLILVSGVLYLYYCTRWQKLLSKIIPYGRMSMTNYVTQGMIGAFIYYNWGLHATIGITYSFLLGIVLFILQYMFCRWWLSTRSHGPFEYAWRRLTWI